MEAIRQLVLRILARGGANKSGIVTTIPPKNLLDFQTMILAEKFMQNGIDPRMFKNADQAENMLKQIEKADEARASGITETQSAKVFNRMGEELDPNKPIIGGTQPGKSIDTDTFIRLADTETQRIKQRIADKKIDDDLPPPGSRGGEDDIAAPFQSQEETLKNMIVAENKKNIAAMKQRKMLDEAIDDASPGFSGDRKTDAELVAENLAERMGLSYDDMPTKERLKLYDQAFTGLSKKKLPPEDMAQGGRAGYKFGIGPLIEFLTKASKTSPLQFGKNYMKNIKEKTLKANETGKFSDLPIAEAGLPAATGAFITNQVKKKLESMNEQERQKNKDEMFKEISEEYKQMYKDKPEFLEKMLLSLHENIYMDKKADGGRVGLKGGSLKKFLERRNFLKTIVGNSPEAENARMLEKILKEQKEFKKFLDKNPSVKFPAPGDKEYDDYILRLNQIMAKDRLKSATGGRIGYKVGGFDKARREFLKMLGLGAGTTAAAKSGILRFSDTAAPKVIEKVAETTTSSVPPPYFFELAEKIKILGKPDKVTYADRVEIHRYTGKNGDSYELIEDLSTGDMKITKEKTGGVHYGEDDVTDGIVDRSVMQYKKGDVDVDPEAGTAYKSADEYDEYKVEFDMDGTEADADDMSEFIRKEIIEEAKSDAPSIKKAGGGIARMLGE